MNKKQQSTLLISVICLNSIATLASVYYVYWGWLGMDKMLLPITFQVVLNMFLSIFLLRICDSDIAINKTIKEMCNTNICSTNGDNISNVSNNDVPNSNENDVIFKIVE